MSANVLAGKFPGPLGLRAECVWRSSVREVTRMSKLHEDVSRALWSLGVSHTNNKLTSDGLFCIDVALDGEKVPHVCIVCSVGAACMYCM